MHKDLSEEARVRRRYVDLIVRDDARQMVRTRAAITRAVRQTLYAQDYIEVETPILQLVHGGAAARPFTTHINAFDIDMTLQDRPRAAPQAHHGGRRGPRLRDGQGVPQRGHRLDALGRIHHARGLHGVGGPAHDRATDPGHRRGGGGRGGVAADRDAEGRHRPRRRVAVAVGLPGHVRAVRRGDHRRHAPGDPAPDRRRARGGVRPQVGRGQDGDGAVLRGDRTGPAAAHVRL